MKWTGGKRRRRLCSLHRHKISFVSFLELPPSSPNNPLNTIDVYNLQIQVTQFNQTSFLFYLIPNIFNASSQALYSSGDGVSSLT